VEVVVATHNAHDVACLDRSWHENVSHVHGRAPLWQALNEACYRVVALTVLALDLVQQGLQLLRRLMCATSKLGIR
jgi:hypothetical protein